MDSDLGLSAETLAEYEAERLRLLAEIERLQDRLAAVVGVIKAHRVLAETLRGKPRPRNRTGTRPGPPGGESDVVEYARRYAATLGPDAAIDIRAATEWALARGWATADKQPARNMARAYDKLATAGEIFKSQQRGGYRTLDQHERTI